MIHLALFAVLITSSASAAIDTSRYDPACGIAIHPDPVSDHRLAATWSTGDESFRLELDGAGPLFRSISVTANGQPAHVLCSDAAAVFTVTLGSRKRNAVDRFVFFDKPASRPHQRHQAVLKTSGVRVTSDGKRADIAFAGLTAGPLSGELIVHLFAGSPLIQVEAELSGDVKDAAYIYEFVVEGNFHNYAWKDTDGLWNRAKAGGDGDYVPIAVKHRAIFAETDAGSLAVIPPPHAFFFPRDRTDNLKFAQIGKGFGLRQDPAGGGAFVPWFDLPPGRVQHMSAFLFPSAGQAEPALERILRYTHGDAFPQLPGRVTFTSHYHSRLTVNELAGKPAAPEFVQVMKGLGVNIVHIAEFHGDGNPDDPGPKRLPQLKAMFDLCAKYSDDKLLLIPGEEGNKYMGHPWPPEKPIHPGHWMYLFPKPVYLTWVRGEKQPWSEDVDGYGTVYHVGDRDDMVRLLQKEGGIGWTTHPRIKASFATPDAFKDQPWYQSDLWLGAAWKAMPADLSNDRLGKRCLDLLDDMNNWGQRKLLPGEVDVFEIDRTHELYGHMNINYLKLDHVPKYSDWSPVLTALKSGDFFVTTGELLIPDWKVETGAEITVTADVQWTFPPAFAELIVGDGKSVKRYRQSLTGETEHGSRQVRWNVPKENAKWVRMEIWDVAMNGAYTQPVWVGPK